MRHDVNSNMPYILIRLPLSYWYPKKLPKIYLKRTHNFNLPMATNDEILKKKIQALAKTYVDECFVEAPVLETYFGKMDLYDVLVSFYNYVENWTETQDGSTHKNRE